MKKIELNASKLTLQKEKITDLNDSRKQKNGDAAYPAVPTTTVWNHTKIPVLCV